MVFKNGEEIDKAIRLVVDHLMEISSCLRDGQLRVHYALAS